MLELNNATASHSATFVENNRWNEKLMHMIMSLNLEQSKEEVPDVKMVLLII